MKLMILVFVLLILQTTFVQAAESEVKTVIDRGGIDTGAMRSLMEKGQMLVIEEDDKGALTMVTAGIIIDKPINEVWDTLTDYAKYPEFMPSTVACKVLKDEGRKKEVYYKIEFKFAVITIGVEYVLNQTYVPNREIRWTLKDSKGKKLKDVKGAYQLAALPGGKTAVFYSVYSDLKGISIVVRKLFEKEPSMEMSVNASSAVMVLKALKNRIENPPPVKGKAADKTKK